MNREVNPYSAPRVPLRDAEPGVPFEGADRSPSSPAELAVYWILRALVASAGLGAFVGVLTAQAESISQRILKIVIGLLLGALMLCPNRLTVEGWLFGCRLVTSVLVGLLFLAVGAVGLNVVDNPVVPIYSVVVGFCLPGCLWWRRSVMTATLPNQGDQDRSLL